MTELQHSWRLMHMITTHRFLPHTGVYQLPEGKRAVEMLFQKTRPSRKDSFDSDPTTADCFKHQFSTTTMNRLLLFLQKHASNPRVDTDPQVYSQARSGYS